MNERAPLLSCAAAVTLSLLSLGTTGAPQTPGSAGAFESLRGCVSPSASDLRRLDAGQAVTQVLDGSDREVSVFAARRVSVDGDRLLAWVDAIERLKRSPAVHAIGRLSAPPRLADLEELTLDSAAVDVLMQCRPGDCAFKLTGEEQRHLRQAGTGQAQGAFREVLLRRVLAYQRDGLSALGHYEDGRTPRPIAETSETLVGRLPCIERNLPGLAHLLASYPALSSEPALSFFYWSQEEFRARPVVLVTHVAAVRQHVAGRTETVVAGRQIYAAHYMNAGLNLTGIVDMPDGRHYLFVLNRTSVDVISGFFGGIVRGMVERRLRSDVSTIIDQVGRRLESGDPGE